MVIACSQMLDAPTDEKKKNNLKMSLVPCSQRRLEGSHDVDTHQVWIVDMSGLTGLSAQSGAMYIIVSHDVTGRSPHTANC